MTTQTKQHRPPTAPQRDYLARWRDLMDRGRKAATVYQDSSGNLLVTTEYRYGLDRILVRPDGTTKWLGAGHVDERRFVPLVDA